MKEIWRNHRCYTKCAWKRLQIETEKPEVLSYTIPCAAQGSNGILATTGPRVLACRRRRLTDLPRYLSYFDSTNRQLNCQETDREGASSVTNTISSSSSSPPPLLSSLDSGISGGQERFYEKSFGRKVADSTNNDDGDRYTTLAATSEAHIATDRDSVDRKKGSTRSSDPDSPSPQKPLQPKTNPEETDNQARREEPPTETTKETDRHETPQNHTSTSASSGASSSPGVEDEKLLPTFELFSQEDSIAERMFRCVRIFAGSSTGYPFSLSRYLGRWWWYDYIV